MAAKNPSTRYLAAVPSQGVRVRRAAGYSLLLQMHVLISDAPSDGQKTTAETSESMVINTASAEP